MRTGHTANSVNNILQERLADGIVATSIYNILACLISRLSDIGLSCSCWRHPLFHLSVALGGTDGGRYQCVSRR